MNKLISIFEISSRLENNESSKSCFFWLWNLLRLREKRDFFWQSGSRKFNSSLLYIFLGFVMAWCFRREKRSNSIAKDQKKNSLEMNTSQRMMINRCDKVFMTFIANTNKLNLWHFNHLRIMFRMFNSCLVFSTVRYKNDKIARKHIKKYEITCCVAWIKSGFSVLYFTTFFSVPFFCHHNFVELF